MAGEAVPYICQFTDSQKQTFQKLEEEMKKKWNITLRWDSKVPENDKWFFHFFTLRGLDREKICDELKNLEQEFEAIHEEMKTIHQGTDVSQEKIQRIRERFEKVLRDMKTMNNSTNSSRLFAATRDVLAKKDDVLRCFDNVEIVQSRKELPMKKKQLEDLKEEMVNKDETVQTMLKLCQDHQQKERKNDDTIEMLQSQANISGENTAEYIEVINELMRKINPMLLDCNVSTEDGHDMKTVVQKNMSVIDALENLSNSFEDSKVRESKRDEKLVSFENKIKSCSWQTSKEFLKLMQLLDKMISSINCDKIEEKKVTLQGSDSCRTDNDSFDSSKDSKLQEQIYEERQKFLKSQIKVSYERNREMREECKELMELMGGMLTDTDAGNPTKSEMVMQTVLGINKHMENKLNKLLKSFMDFSEREMKRDDKIGHLENQITVKSREILRQIAEMMEWIGE